MVRIRIWIRKYSSCRYYNLILGLAYYISPPRSFGEIFIDPLHMLAYTIFILGSCSFFSKLWIEISGESARDIAKRLRD
jgi:protein transport protein SEC61 subunit alpha